MIVTDEALLRTYCQDVLPEEVVSLRETLENELKRSGELGRPGIGLAAPQVSLDGGKTVIAKKMAIVRVPSGNDLLSVDLVNCRIAEGINSAIFIDEGCLSFPGIVDKTRRFQEIYVVGNLVYPHSFIATGLLAVAIQHELDHLEGILLPDRVLKN